MVQVPGRLQQLTALNLQGACDTLAGLHCMTGLLQLQRLKFADHGQYTCMDTSQAIKAATSKVLHWTAAPRRERTG